MSGISGQSIGDRISAAKYSIAGQGLAKSVRKATTEEVIGPKKKHLDYLLQCTNEPNVSIPQMADYLIERTQNKMWMVACKALITIHNLMNYGNERFSQYLASKNTNFHLDNFYDKATIQGQEMSKFVRKYSKYIHEKCISYRLMAFDFCKVKRGKDDGLLRCMNGEKLLKTLPVLQNQLDALLEFDVNASELNNGVVNASFLLLFKDLIRLFACYNDGIINLLEKYFEMNKKQCKEALDLYKKFLVRMEKVSEFLRVAESIGVDKGDIPDLAKAPSSLLDALEQHLQSLEGKKGGSTPTGTRPPSGFQTAVSNFSKGSMSATAAGISEDERRKALDDEKRQLEQIQYDQPNAEMKMSPSSGAAPPMSANNPFAAQPTPAATGASGQSMDLFGSDAFQEKPPPAAAAASNNQGQARPSDDLLSLTGTNPFLQTINTVQQQQQQQQNVQQTHAQPNAFMAPTSTISTNPWANTAPAFSSTSVNKEINFDAAFGNEQQQAQQAGFDGFGEIMRPTMNKNLDGKTTKDEKLIKKDLDSSLASLAGNLNINGPGHNLKKTEHQWSPSANKGQKTGGANWQAPAPATGMPGAWPQQGTPQTMGGAAQPMAGYTGMQQPYNAVRPGMAPMGQQPGMFPGAMPAQQQFIPQGQPMMQQQRPQQPPVNDPFGL